jgi:hypothetical protein
MFMESTIYLLIEEVALKLDRMYLFLAISRLQVTF